MKQQNERTVNPIHRPRRLWLRRIPLVAALWLPTLAWSAADLLSDVAARVTQAPVIRGKFEQQRQLAGFDKPLRSRGDFVVARDRGMIWATREPLVSTLVATPDSLVVRDGQGHVQQRIAPGGQAGMQAVGDSVTALLRADFAPLSRAFDIDGKLGSGRAWQLVLTPRDAAMKRAVTRIELAGDRYVREVRVREAGGDVTQVRLLAVQGADTLSSDEERDFD